MKKTYALVGASAAVGAAIGPLIGGFVTTYLSWRVGFLMEAVIIAIVLANIKLVRDVAYTGLRKIDVVGAGLSVVGMGGIVLGILVWQEGGEFVLLIMAIGAVALAALAYWLVKRKREGKVRAARPEPVQDPELPGRRLADGAPADHARRSDDRHPALSAGDARVQRDAGRAVARPALADDVRRRAARREEDGEATPGQHHPDRLRSRVRRHAADHPGDPPRRVRLGAPRAAPDRRNGPRPARLAAQQLHPGPDRGRTGQRGCRGQLRRPVLRAVVRARARGRHPPRRTVAELHQHGRGQRR